MVDTIIERLTVQKPIALDDQKKEEVYQRLNNVDKLYKEPELVDKSANSYEITHSTEVFHYDTKTQDIKHVKEYRYRTLDGSKVSVFVEGLPETRLSSDIYGHLLWKLRELQMQELEPSNQPSTFEEDFITTNIHQLRALLDPSFTKFEDLDPVFFDRIPGVDLVVLTPNNLLVFDFVRKPDEQKEEPLSVFRQIPGVSNIIGSETPLTQANVYGFTTHDQHTITIGFKPQTSPSQAVK